MSPGHEQYLAVLKASYDYKPQSEDEIAITEGQILFLKEQVDDDWWKVKVKGDPQDDNAPVGLVPAAYVEQAEHTSKVKVLYEYEAAADGELSVQEDEILLVFETEDWILAQSEKEGGKAGFVPGNYVEPYTEETVGSSHRIVVPPSSPRPISTYVDPADRVAAARVTADGITTWSVSEVDKKGKKKKGTLGVGNGAVFFASESDKTPVQKWQTADVQNVSNEKTKHVNIEIGGTTPVTLHYHVGSKDNAEEIIAKLNSSKALSTSQNFAHDDTSQEHKSVRKHASVHFSNSSPVIIPSRDDAGTSSEPEEDEKPHANGINENDRSMHDGEAGAALYDFVADGVDELSVSEGEQLIILEKDGDEWWKCRNSRGKEGVVPASYIELSVSAASSTTTKATRAPTPPPSPPPEEEEDGDAAAEAERQRVEAERAAKEQREQERLRGEQERLREEQAKKKADARRRANEAAEAAELERKRRMEAASRVSSPPVAEQKKTTSQNKQSSSLGKPSGEINRPSPDQTRIWHDRTGQFRVEAAFVGFSNGKLRLHKVNGVIVEVPSEKMSLEDMKYIERLMSKKKSRPPETRQVSEDDVPLALSRPGQTASRSAPPKAAPKIDWFDFFLSAGCDLDDCTRYAAAFEKDKLDESIIQDITDETMRLLGVREGDIIRIKKAIEKRKPTDNLYKPSAYIQEQVLRDEELARKLQAQESGARAPAPNLFAAGPGGVLKTQTRRGRPVPSKSMPPAAVDLNAISAISTTTDAMQRTSSPQVSTPASAPASSTTPNVPRSNSAAPNVSGFDDDAWTNRPSSTKPLVGTPAPRAPSVPPAQSPVATSTVGTSPSAAAPPATIPAPSSTPTTAPPPATSSHNLANTTEDDVFKRLAQYGEMRKQGTPVQPPPVSPPVAIPPSFQGGLGMGSSPTPMGQLLQVPLVSPPQQAAPYNGPRGPFAPVPANQALLQPLIPTQTGFTGMIPTRAPSSVSPFSNNISPSFLNPQPTGFSPAHPLMSQPTGMTLNSFGTIQPSSPITPLHNQFTGFNPNFGQSPFNNPSFNNTPPPVPPLPNTSSMTNNTSPANVFAQMKSGTFAAEHTANVQTPPWPYQGAFKGFQS